MAVQDKIERQMVLRASRDKVWDAITKPENLTKWLATGMSVGRLDEGQEFRFIWQGENNYARAVVEVMEPKTRFAYRWEHSSQDQTMALADAPTSLVTFLLEDVEGGTRLTLTETGLAGLPDAARVFSENSTGWATQLVELQTFVEAA